MSADAELDALFALPPEEFTAARNALAKTRPEVKALRRPTQAAWAVNRLARERRGQLDDLVAAGRQLRHAQARGGDVAAATREERDALEALVAEARRLGAESDASLQRVRATLQAAAADEGAAARVLEGRLEKELDAPGFEPLLALAASAPRRAPARKPAPPKRDRAAERRLQEAEAVLTEAEREEARARREWERAQKATERARAAVDAARAGVVGS